MVRRNQALPPPPDRASTPDPAAEELAEIYRRYYDAVWRTLACLGVAPAMIDDAVQEVFLVVHRRAVDRPDEPALKPWIYGITRRVAWRQHRTSDRAARRLGLVQQPPPPVQPDDVLLRTEAMRFVYDFVGTLEPDQRLAFVLVDVEGLTVPEAAHVAGAKLATTHSRLRLARQRFEAALARRRARVRREHGDAV